MPLVTDTGTYCTGREAAQRLGMSYGTFANKRTERGDRFIRGHALLHGRIFFKIEDIEAYEARGRC